MHYLHMISSKYELCAWARQRYWSYRFRLQRLCSFINKNMREEPLTELQRIK